MSYVVANQTAFGPEEERAYREFQRQWGDTVDPLAGDLATAVRRGQIDLGTLDAIRSDVEPTVGRYARDIEVAFREVSRDAARAGRTIAARRNQLDIAFDRIPQETIDELDDWVTTVSEEVADTLEDEVTQYLKGAREEGLDIETVADEFQNEFVEDRLKDTKAEQLGRDAVQGPSEAGNHSAIRESGAIGERWSTNLDGRERDTHAEADGQVVATDQPFIVGGYRAQHPHDPQLPVEEATNCRCQVLAVWPDKLTEAQMQALEAGERIWL